MLTEINQQNHQAFDVLVQAYEDEFSPVTGKKKNKDGLYSLDASWQDPFTGYYWQEGKEIIGFVIFSRDQSFYDVAEFYITPKWRGNGIGKKMAFALFNKYPGTWQVRQIQGAELAKVFWRKVIHHYTFGDYTESEVEDTLWGRVTRQEFKATPHK